MSTSWPRLAPAARWRDRTLAERAQAIEAACRAAIQLLEGAPDRAARLAQVDPVPESTRALLRRLAAR